jgi:hypothetical protein
MIVLLISAHGGYYLQNAFVADAKAVSNAGVAGITNKNPVITTTVNQHEINLKLRYAHFLSIPTSIINNAHQFKVIVNYTASTFNSPILNKTINANNESLCFKWNFNKDILLSEGICCNTFW